MSVFVLETWLRSLRKGDPITIYLYGDDCQTGVFESADDKHIYLSGGAKILSVTISRGALTSETDRRKDLRRAGQDELFHGHRQVPLDLD